MWQLDRRGRSDLNHSDLLTHSEIQALLRQHQPLSDLELQAYEVTPFAGHGSALLRASAHHNFTADGACSSNVADVLVRHRAASATRASAVSRNESRHTHDQYKRQRQTRQHSLEAIHSASSPEGPPTPRPDDYKTCNSAHAKNDRAKALGVGMQRGHCSSA